MTAGLEDSGRDACASGGYPGSCPLSGIGAEGRTALILATPGMAGVEEECDAPAADPAPLRLAVRGVAPREEGRRKKESYALGGGRHGRGQGGSIGVSFHCQRSGSRGGNAI